MTNNKQPSSGFYLALEGLEGCGKTTAIATITEWFEQRNCQPVVVREPGGTPMAEAIRNIVKQDFDEVVDPITETLLMFGARRQLLTQRVSPALSDRQIVISDRHFWSSIAYQQAGHGVDERLMSALSTSVVRGCVPNLVLFLDIDPEVGLARARNRATLDRIERNELSFFSRARDTFRQLAATSNNCITIDAAQPLASVQEAIRVVLDEQVVSLFG